MFQILVAEDEEHLRGILVSTLENEGYAVTAVTNGKEAYEAYCKDKQDLIVSDIMMPVMDGNELTQKIREISKDTPIILLTALETIEDKEKGFTSGADDYLTKPFSLRELLLRVKALLRRYGAVYENTLILPHTKLHYNMNTVKINDKNIELNKKEFLLLFKLLSNPNIIFSREQLLEDIWGYDSTSVDRTVDTHIKWLRDKAKSPDFEIVTVRGLGYKAVMKFE